MAQESPLFSEDVNNTLQKNKKRVEIRSRVREFVFGIQDGLISTVGLLAGIQVATGNQQMVLLTGVAAMVTGALSMATGSYLATRAEQEIFEKELKDQAVFVDRQPDQAKEGLMEVLVQEGLSRQVAYGVVRLLAEQKQTFIQTFQEKVLGIGSAEIRKPLQAAAVMYVSFVVGAAIPLAPYLFFSDMEALLVSCGFSALALFGVGSWKGKLAGRSPLQSGLHFFLVAMGSGGVGFLVGKGFERLMGHF